MLARSFKYCSVPQAIPGPFLPNILMEEATVIRDIFFKMLYLICNSAEVNSRGRAEPEYPIQNGTNKVFLVNTYFK